MSSIKQCQSITSLLVSFPRTFWSPPLQISLLLAMKTLNERHHQTLGGHQAQALSHHLSLLNKKLKASHGIDTTPDYISLVGCSLADKDGEGSKSYVQQLGEALHQKAGWRLEMGARQLPVSVNEEGRKMSVVKGANRPVSDKSDKIVFNWAPQNEFVPKNSLTARVNRVLTLMDSLALGKQTIGRSMNNNGVMRLIFSIIRTVSSISYVSC